MPDDKTKHDFATQDWRNSISSAKTTPPVIHHLNESKGSSFNIIIRGLGAAFVVWFIASIPFLLVKAAVTGDYKLDAGSAQTMQHPALANAVDIIGWIVSLALAFGKFLKTIKNK